MDSALIQLKDALDLYQVQYGATDRLWAYFSTVSLALVSYAIGSDRLSKSFIETAVVLATYLVFCIGNHAALSAAQAQLVSLGKMAKGLGADRVGVVLEPIPVDRLQIYYWSLVAAICIAVMFVGWTRRKARSRIRQAD